MVVITIVALVLTLVLRGHEFMRRAVMHLDLSMRSPNWRPVKTSSTGLLGTSTLMDLYDPSILALSPYHEVHNQMVMMYEPAARDPWLPVESAPRESK